VRAGHPCKVQETRNEVLVSPIRQISANSKDADFTRKLFPLHEKRENAYAFSLSLDRPRRPADNYSAQNAAGALSSLKTGLWLKS